MGIAAVGGAFMNLNFMLAGSASTNPVLLLVGFLLVLAWKTAGYIGLDRWLLSLLNAVAARSGALTNAGSLALGRSRLSARTRG